MEKDDISSWCKYYQDDVSFDKDTKIPVSQQIKKIATLNDSIADFNREFSIITRGNQVFILREIYDPVNESREISFLGREAFLLLNENKISFDDKGKVISHARRWLMNPSRRSYDGLVFKPYGYNAAPPYIGNSYNLWRGLSFEPASGYIGIEKLLFFDHLKNHVCLGNHEWFEWLLGWMADIYQRPNKKPGSAIVLRGLRRTGKGIVGRILGKLISRHYMQIMHTSQVTGRFNNHLSDKILIFLDEAFWAGDKEAEGPLKSLITEPSISVEMKGKDVQHIDSYCRIIIATNNDWAIPTGLNDENRFAVFDLANNVLGNTNYFSQMEREMDEGGYAALLDFFLNYKYKADDLRKAPLTDALLEQKQHSLQPHEKWLFEKLQDGYIKKDGDYFIWPIKIKLDEVYASYLEFCTNMKVRYPIDKHMMTKNLNKFITIESTSQSGERYWKLPSLSMARGEFEIKMGHSIKWQYDE